MPADCPRRFLSFISALLLSITPPLFGANSVRHLTERTTLESGRTRVIAFSVTEPQETDRTFSASLEPDRAGRIISSATVLAGETVGFVRVLGGAPGAASLMIDAAALELDVRPILEDPLNPEHPRIINPTDGAVTWGMISVGVTLRFSPHEALRDVLLRVDDLAPVDAWEDTGKLLAPLRQLRFEVDTQQLAAGVHTMTAVIVNRDGTQQPGRPVHFVVHHPDAADLVTGEAEAQYDVERPARFADTRRNIGRNRAASGGRYFANSSSLPAVCFPIEVEEPGWYQVIVRAAGTRGKGVMPTIALVVNDEPQAATNGRVLGESWHRLAVGVPIPLDAGTHVLTPLFVNDLYVANRADRNLKLDVIEVARVSDAPVGDDPESAALATLAVQAGRGVLDFAANAPDTFALNDPFGLRDDPLRIALRTALDQRVIAGVTEVKGRCWWPEPSHAPAPLVTLRINGNEVSTQRSAAPRFWVDPGHFTAGANTIQLIARADGGLTAQTPTITVYRPTATAAETTDPIRQHVRFSIHDSGWQSGTGASFTSEGNPDEQRSVQFGTQGACTLDLPETLTGRHLLQLECRRIGDSRSNVEVVLEANGATTAIGHCRPPGWWGEPVVGWVDLPPGPKRLRFRIAPNGEPDGEQDGERNDRNRAPLRRATPDSFSLQIQGAMLGRDGDQPDRTPPHVTLHYPPEGHEVWLADAVVVTVSDDRSVASLEVLFNDRATGISRDLTLAPGDLTIPLPLRSLPSGEHTLRVRVTDRAGNSVLSEPRTIRVLAAAPNTPGPYRRAVHLLNRLAYGPDERELGHILTDGAAAWLTDRLAPYAGFDAAEQNTIAIAATSFPERGRYQIPRRAIARRLVTTNPVRSRLEDWVENHFSTWIAKIEGPRKWQEHLTLGARVAQGFDHLLFASAEGPAMMAYLDQVESYEGQLNENYAREVMELHTVGVHGGYDQEDVTQLAKLLTGWTIANEGDGRGGTINALVPTFRFDPTLGSGDPLQVMGLRFPETSSRLRYDRARHALEMLVAHPATARFIADKLAAHYLGEDTRDPNNRAPNTGPEVQRHVHHQLKEELAVRYLETGGNLMQMLLHLAQHPAFLDAPPGGRLAHPSDFALRLCRQTTHRNPGMIADFLQRSGVGYFDRATPDGHPEEDLAYADSNALMQRWRFAREMQGPILQLVPGAWRSGGGGRNEPDTRWTQSVIDIIAIRLTGDVLSQSSNDAALQLAAALDGTRYDRIRRLGPFIAHLPEVNLR